MKKYQRQYKSGTEYLIQGPSERNRRVTFVGRAKIEGKEILMFRAVRKSKKRHDSN